MPTPKGTVPWNAGTGKGWTDKRGYRWIYITENGKRRAKREHRHIMEQHLGRVLRPEEVVHHKNEDPSDNRIENLVVELWSEHTAHHTNGRRQSEYAKRTQSVIAEYREANKRLRDLNADMLAALKTAWSHIEHMSKWIAAQGAGYSFEALGEDAEEIRAAIAAATDAQPDHPYVAGLMSGMNDDPSLDPDRLREDRDEQRRIAREDGDAS